MLNLLKDVEKIITADPHIMSSLTFDSVRMVHISEILKNKTETTKLPAITIQSIQTRPSPWSVMYEEKIIVLDMYGQRGYQELLYLYWDTRPATITSYGQPKGLRTLFHNQTYNFDDGLSWVCYEIDSSQDFYEYLHLYNVNMRIRMHIRDNNFSNVKTRIRP